MLGDLEVPAALQTILGEVEAARQAARIELLCPKCRVTFYALAGPTGTQESCPLCGFKVTVPPPQQAAPAPPIQPPMNVPVAQSMPPPSPGYAQQATNTPESPWAGVDEPSGSPPYTQPPGYPSPAYPGAAFTNQPPIASPPGSFFGSPKFGAHKEHSGLGIASFLIALLVGGLDILLGIVIALNVSSSQSEGELLGSVLSGAMGMVCLNCMSIPLCIVGAGLGGVALIAHQNRNHLFTWMGLIGNSIVILAVLGVFVWGKIESSGSKKKSRMQNIQWRMSDPEFNRVHGRQ